MNQELLPNRRLFSSRLFLNRLAGKSASGTFGRVRFSAPLAVLLFSIVMSSCATQTQSRADSVGSSVSSSVGSSAGNDVTHSTTDSHASQISGHNWQSYSVSYRCENNQVLQIVYLMIDSADALAAVGDQSFAVLGFNDQLVLMTQRISASGIRYIAVDEQNSYRWYGKGNEGFLNFMEADHTASEQTIFNNCVAE